MLDAHSRFIYIDEHHHLLITVISYLPLNISRSLTTPSASIKRPQPLISEDDSLIEVRKSNSSISSDNLILIALTERNIWRIVPRSFISLYWNFEICKFTDYCKNSKIILINLVHIMGSCTVTLYCMFFHITCSSTYISIRNASSRQFIMNLSCPSYTVSEPGNSNVIAANRVN